MANELITFACGCCRAPLGVRARELAACGGVAQCPACRAANHVEVPRSLADDDPSVDMSLSVPGGPEFTSKVSRSDAGKMAFTVLGAALAVGAALLGWRISRQPEGPARPS